MTIQELATKAGKGNRTIQRWIETYNSKNNTIFESGLNAIITDDDLLNYLFGRMKPANNDNPEKPNKDKPKRKSKKNTSEVVEVKNDWLQRLLSSNGLIVFVLVIILLADMFAFGTIGEHEFSNRVKYPFVFFGLLGFAVGIGSIVSYNKMENRNHADWWKWFFGLLQFLVFFLTINEFWIAAEFIMTLMFVLVFISVQKAIK